MNHLTDICLENSFSVNYLFTLLMVTFDEQNFLILMQFNLSIFPLNSVSFVSYLRNLGLLQVMRMFSRGCIYKAPTGPSIPLISLSILVSLLFLYYLNYHSV